MINCEKVKDMDTKSPRGPEEPGILNVLTNSGSI